MAPDRRASPADEVTRSLSDYQEHQVPPGPYRLYAREYPGVEPTLELLHGFPDNLHLYDRLLPHLHPPRRVITGVLTWDEERGDGGLLMLLLPRGQATDRSRAIEFLQEAVADARAIGMTLVCEGFQALQAALAGAMVPAGPAAAEVAAMAEAANNLFRREGQYWTVVFDGAVARLKHTKGLGHLARLLAQPGREFHTLDLEAADGQPPKARAGRSERELAVRRDLGDAGVLLDATAKAAYQARLEELQAELEEAEDYNDPTRAAMARQELDVLVGELARAVGVGRPRPPGGLPCRTRQAERDQGDPGGDGQLGRGQPGVRAASGCDGPHGPLLLLHPRPACPDHLEADPGRAVQHKAGRDDTPASRSGQRAAPPTSRGPSCRCSRTKEQRFTCVERTDGEDAQPWRLSSSPSA